MASYVEVMDIKRHSKRLSWLLRHGALESGLPMDSAGWAPIHEVLARARMSRDALDRCVAQNDKQRLQVDGDRIRATQGHSTAGTPVTAEALEASWTRVLDRRQPLFHGTRTDLVEPIARSGLRPMGRTHVHLAGSRQAKVGKRANVSVLLRIDPALLEQAGVGLFCSPNGVFLVRQVPWGCVVDVEPISRRARSQAGVLRGLLQGARAG